MADKRYALPFFQVESPAFSKDRETLLDYPMPITKIIEDQSLRDMHDMEDALFFGMFQPPLTESEDFYLVEASDTFIF